MQTVLILIALATFAYVLAHYVVEHLQARFLVTGGVEYLVLGLLIGPHMAWGSALSAKTLEDLQPIMTLVIGGVGLLLGLRANFRSLLFRDDGASHLAATVFLASITAVGAGAWLLLRAPLLGSFEPPDVMAGAWVLAASAAVTSPAALDLVQRRFNAHGRLTTMLEGAMSAGQLLGIVGFGVVFCVFHDPVPGYEGWDYANWLLITVVVGGGLGLLFRAFIGDDADDPDHVFLAMLGIIVFASGAAYTLELSPMLVNLVLGMVLANIARCADDILDAMERLRRPVGLMLLVLAGALWQPIPWTGWIVAATYVLLRLTAQLLGGWAASVSLDGVPRDIGRGLLSQGEVAVAMVVSYRIVFEGPVVDIVFTAVLVGVVFSELTSARQLKALLIDGGDIQRDDPGTRGDAPIVGPGDVPTDREPPALPTTPAPQPGA